MNTPGSAADPPRAVDLSRDFGGRSQRVAIIGAALLGIAGLVGVGQDWIQHTKEGIAGYKAWTVTGPPCTTIAPASSVTVGHPLQVVAFGGAKFAREHGAIPCSDVATGGGWGFGLYPVCQFDHPGLIEVSTRAGLYRYWAGFMSPATISIAHGAPVCVVGANQDFGHRLIFDKPSGGPH
ncbi:MAG TPA: hypothetical protein VGF71_17940 [Caulobacteraceae bacterium]